jgi:hypothetical protein
MRAVENNSSFLFKNFLVKSKCNNLEIFSIQGKNKSNKNPFYLMPLFKENYNQKLLNIISGRIINLLFLKNDFAIAYKNGVA